MTLADYGAATTVRHGNRDTHARLAARYDTAITLAAPVGLGSTGNPVFNVPASMLGILALSLRYSRLTACRWACRSPVLLVKTPGCSRSRPQSAICWAR